MIILAVQDIQKSFGTHEVLKGVSFTLQEQERMGLVGVNGSGKSTLMKIIAGIETADGGTVSTFPFTGRIGAAAFYSFTFTIEGLITLPLSLYPFCRTSVTFPLSKSGLLSVRTA